MALKNMKDIELVMDYSIWPRYEAAGLDSTNVSRMCEALRAGITLPPIIADIKSYRIVDGFHRASALLKVFGDEADAIVDLKDYQSESEIFLEAVQTNANHGLPMSPKDRAHAIIVARRYKIPPAVLAAALGMEPESMKKFFEARTAKSQSGETIPLSNGASGLAGKILDSSQEHFAKTANGGLPEMYASMLINALKARAMDLSPKTRARLVELRDLIDEVLK